jgi:hypothetical protein
MSLPVQMHDYTWSQLLKDNPEWTTVAFSAFTTLVIVWQVVVMILQGRSADQRERHQNNLIRLQHEHEWLDALNAKREGILKTATKLHINVLFIIGNHNANDDVVWSELLKLRSELKLQPETLDVAAYTTDKDGWYEKLAGWSDALFKIITEYFKTVTETGTVNVPNIPPMATRNALKAAKVTFHRLHPCMVFSNPSSTIPGYSRRNGILKRNPRTLPQKQTASQTWVHRSLLQSRSCCGALGRNAESRQTPIWGSPSFEYRHRNKVRFPG